MIARGMRGDMVQHVQGLLTETGLYTGRVDSIYGEKTEAAVSGFQSATGRPATGVWDTATNQAALELLQQYNPQGTTNPVYPTLNGSEQP